MRYHDKVQKLKQQIGVYTKEDVTVAFSGGVDSSLILRLALECAGESGRKVYAMFLNTMLHPAREAKDAEMAARKMGAEFLTIEADELGEAGILDNPKDRCYRCKKYLFEQMKTKSEELGAAYVLEGTNEDDLHVYRPGIRAIREMGIKSPLADAGFTKEEVRRMAEELGLPASGKPSVPCLATRFPYGDRLTYEKMQKVEAGEKYLREQGFYNVRLRVHGETARIEVDIGAMETLLKGRKELVRKMKELGYAYVTLDLEGFRSGSMDIETQQSVSG